MADRTAKQSGNDPYEFEETDEDFGTFISFRAFTPIKLCQEILQEVLGNVVRKVSDVELDVIFDKVLEDDVDLATVEPKSHNDDDKVIEIALDVIFDKVLQDDDDLPTVEPKSHNDDENLKRIFESILEENYVFVNQVCSKKPKKRCEFNSQSSSHMEVGWGDNGGDDSLKMYQAADVVTKEDDSDSDMFSDSENKVFPDNPNDEENAEESGAKIEADIEMETDALRCLLRDLGLRYSDIVVKHCMNTKGMVICDMTCKMDIKTNLKCRLARQSREMAVAAAHRDISSQVRKKYFPDMVKLDEELSGHKQKLTNLCKTRNRPDPVFYSWLEHGLYCASVWVGEDTASSLGSYQVLAEAEGSAAKLWLDLFGGVKVNKVSVCEAFSVDLDDEFVDERFSEENRTDLMESRSTRRPQAATKTSPSVPKGSISTRRPKAATKSSTGASKLESSLTKKSKIKSQGANKTATELDSRSCVQRVVDKNQREKKNFHSYTDVDHIFRVSEPSLEDVLKIPEASEVAREANLDALDRQIIERREEHELEMSVVVKAIQSEKARQKLKRKRFKENALRRNQIEAELSETHLAELFQKNKNLLIRIENEEEYSDRHEAFSKGGVFRDALVKRRIVSPFTDEHLDFTLNEMEKIWIGKSEYLWKVLLPEFFIQVGFKNL